ncbi:MAG TPA: sterol desaturase family protein [Vicinamibacteria bacterium]|nr:sterol desaturase family protein [Vicinamibacteria bacterium]
MNVTLAVTAVALAMMVVEAARPGRRWPQVRGWWLRAVALNAVQVGSVFLAGATYDRWMASQRLWPAPLLGSVAGAAVGYIAITFVYYWWHRARHASPLLWRLFHQVHHSPQRIEIITSFYKHPLEILVNGVLSSAILYLGLGLTPDAAAGAVALSGLGELVYHWNVRTPYWMGFVFQRPESHCVHHQEGVHSFNYSDLPVWDMLFGTFRNPRRFEARCGLGPTGELRLAEMLRGVDVEAAGATRA